MNIKNSKKILHYILVGIIVIVAGISLLFYYNQSMAYAPPPASHLFLLIPPKPSVSKNLCSSAANTQLGATCHPASSFGSDPFPVNRGEELLIKIRYQPPTSIGDGDYPELIRIDERISGGVFSYQGVSVSPNVNYTYSGPSEGQLIDNALLRYDFENGFAPEEDVELVIRLKAEEYTVSGPVGVDVGNSYLRYRDDGSNNNLDLDEALVSVTDIIGPKGDIYSHGNVDNSSGVLGYELDEIDLVGAGNNVTGFGNNPDWKVSNYDLRTGDESYRDEKYYDYYLNQITKRVELLVDERAEIITNSVQLNNNENIVYYENGSLNIGSNIVFADHKTVIAKQDINIDSVNIDSGNNGVVFISLNGDINIRNSSGGIRLVKANFVALNGAVKVDNQGASHLIIKGSLASKSFELLGNNRVSYIYNTIGISDLPGIASIYDSRPYEHY
jgi:hypothetical protein